MFRKTSRWLAFAGLMALVLVACSSSTGSSSVPASTTDSGGNPSGDLLARIQERGTLVGYAELDYPPQSIRVEGATRPATTKCQPDQLTGAEVSGYDIETTSSLRRTSASSPALPVRRGPRSPAATGGTAGISPTALVRSTPTA